MSQNGAQSLRKDSAKQISALEGMKRWAELYFRAPSRSRAQNSRYFGLLDGAKLSILTTFERSEALERACAVLASAQVAPRERKTKM